MTQQRAARALRSLAVNNPSSSTIIVNAGAISPLVTLLATGATGAREEAKVALHTLALNAPSNQLAIATGLVALLCTGAAEAQEHVTRLLLTLAADATNRVAIAKAGAIGRLVMQLKQGKEAGGSLACQTSLKSQELAAAVLAQLSADSEANVGAIAACASTKALIALLGSASESAQAHAAAVLADLTRGSREMQGDQGRSDEIDARSREMQEDVAREGGIELLVGLLSGEHACTEAANAIWSIAAGDEDMKHMVARTGAIPPLVALLGRPGVVRLRAAGALGTLACGLAVHQNAIAAAGGLAPLVSLLGDGGKLSASPAESEAHAARALASLADGHVSNAIAIAEAGGIVPLVQVADSDCHRLPPIATHCH